VARDKRKARQSPGFVLRFRLSKKLVQCLENSWNNEMSQEAVQSTNTEILASPE
jgi:hypothetical protein